MAYYNYHAKVKQRIKSGDLQYYYFSPKYKNIGFALVLCFSDKKYPIREKHFQQYFDLIGQFYITTQIDRVFKTKSVFDKNLK